MAFTQLSLENVTPQPRRFLVTSQPYEVGRVQTIVANAWQDFLLQTGEMELAAFSSSFQVIARSLGAQAGHQSVFAEAEVPSTRRFVLENGKPRLAPDGTQAPPSSIMIANASDELAMVRIDNDFSTWFGEHLVPPQGTLALVPGAKAYFFASVPVTDPEAPVVLEPVTAEVSLEASPVAVQLLMQGSALRWKIS